MADELIASFMNAPYSLSSSAYEPRRHRAIIQLQNCIHSIIVMHLVVCQCRAIVMQALLRVLFSLAKEKMHMPWVIIHVGGKFRLTVCSNFIAIWNTYSPGLVTFINIIAIAIHMHGLAASSITLCVCILIHYNVMWHWFMQLCPCCRGLL